METPATARPLSAKPYTTYRIGGMMDASCYPQTPEQAVSLLEHAHSENKSLTILGWGSNSIVASSGIRGVTVITRKLTSSRQIDDTCWEFGAGVHFAKVAKLAQDHHLTGAEYMIGIPATIGGAVRMNAGALGQETASLVESVTLFNTTNQQVEMWTPDQLGYRYRHSHIDPDHHIVLSARLRFQPGDINRITRMMEDSVAFRKAHHPTEPNGGSVFQNPVREMTVGRMLDELGAKGWREGGVCISPRHANFIINTDDGSSTDLLKLMLRMKQAVKAEYGYAILPENKLLGDITAEERDMWAALNAV